MSIILGLVVLGLVFTFFEVIVPGGLLGVLAGGAIIWACVLTFQNYGLMPTLAVFMGSLILVIILVVAEIKLMSRTKLGRRLFLDKSVDSQSTHALGTDELIGKTGEAETTLAPSGKIIVEEKEYEAFSEDGLIKKGEAVKVVGRDNFRIVVKKA